MEVARLGCLPRSSSQNSTSLNSDVKQNITRRIFLLGILVNRTPPAGNTTTGGSTVKTSHRGKPHARFCPTRHPGGGIPRLADRQWCCLRKIRLRHTQNFILSAALRDKVLVFLRKTRLTRVWRLRAVQWLRARPNCLTAFGNFAKLVCYVQYYSRKSF